MLKSVWYVSSTCRRALGQRILMKALSSDDKKSKNITTMFGDIVIEYEPYKVRIFC